MRKIVSKATISYLLRPLFEESKSTFDFEKETVLTKIKKNKCGPWEMPQFLLTSGHILEFLSDL